MKTVLSCIQPTGDMHFGNYFGAVKNYVALQSKYKCIYGVVDYHAMTMPYNPRKLRQNTWEIIFNLLGTGVKPENLFIQSLVPEHAELGWILNNFAAFGRVENMTQFKDKSQHNKSSKDGFISVGLFDYPVLQAADILIYKADFVPVGEDQKQHLELTKEVASRFNHQIGKDYFALPEILYTETPKIKSTANPARKMSKSAGEKHYIGVFSDEARIRKQIKSAVTDTGAESEEMSVGIANLFELLKAGEDMVAYRSLMESYNNKSLSYADLKEAVANVLINHSKEFKERKEGFLIDKRQTKDQIKESTIAIRKIAQETLREVKELCGLINVKF